MKLGLEKCEKEKSDCCKTEEPKEDKKPDKPDTTDDSTQTVEDSKESGLPQTVIPDKNKDSTQVEASQKSETRKVEAVNGSKKEVVHSNKTMTTKSSSVIPKTGEAGVMSPVMGLLFSSGGLYLVKKRKDGDED